VKLLTSDRDRVQSDLTYSRGDGVHVYEEVEHALDHHDGSDVHDHFPPVRVDKQSKVSPHESHAESRLSQCVDGEDASTAA
jgi:hypothetical protein